MALQAAVIKGEVKDVRRPPVPATSLLVSISSPAPRRRNADLKHSEDLRSAD